MTKVISFTYNTLNIIFLQGPSIKPEKLIIKYRLLGTDENWKKKDVIYDTTNTNKEKETYMTGKLCRKYELRYKKEHN
jgi:hypothetical protein